MFSGLEVSSKGLVEREDGSKTLSIRIILQKRMRMQGVSYINARLESALMAVIKGLVGWNAALNTRFAKKCVMRK